MVTNMAHDKSYYVIVGRDGTRPVTRWSPAEIDVAAAPHGASRDRHPEHGAYDKVELGRTERFDDAAS